MGYTLATQKRVNPRTARPAFSAGAPYLVLLKAHYISGFGLVQPGGVVTLAEGCKPGKFLLALTDEQATECSKDPVYAARLAADSGEKLQKGIDEARKLRVEDLKIDPPTDADAKAEPGKADSPKDKGK